MLYYYFEQPGHTKVRRTVPPLGLRHPNVDSLTLGTGEAPGSNLPRLVVADLDLARPPNHPDRTQYLDFATADLANPLAGRDFDMKLR